MAVPFRKAQERGHPLPLAKLSQSLFDLGLPTGRWLQADICGLVQLFCRSLATPI